MLFARQFIEQCSEAVPFDHNWCGVTQLLWDKKSSAKLNKIAQVKLPKELLVKLTPAETNQTVGLPVDMESLHYPLGGWLCPAELTSNLLQSLAESGSLNVCWNTSIDQLNWNPDEKLWSLKSGDNETKHQAVVIANGHNFDIYQQTKYLPLGKVKGQVSHIPTTENLSKLKTVLCYDGYMTPHNPKTSQHCIGASYDRTHIDQHFDLQAQLDNAEKLANCIQDQDWPKEVDVSENASRQGIRCVSRDHLPFVGNVGDFNQIIDNFDRGDSSQELPQYSNLYCLLGLGSRGLSSSPLMAEVLASQICGDPLPLPADVLESIHPSKMWVRKLLKGKAIQR